MHMSDSEPPNTQPADSNPAVAGAVAENCCAAPCTWLGQAEAFARREPAKAVASAFGAGLVLHLLPLRAVTAVALALARPALISLGLLKLWELCPCEKETKSNP